MALFLSTVSADVTITDLKGYTFVHPLVDYPLYDLFTEQDIEESINLQTEVTNGTVVITDENSRVVLDLSSAVYMLQATYDANNDGKVDAEASQVESVNGQTGLVNITDPTFSGTTAIVGSGIGNVPDDGVVGVGDRALFDDGLWKNVNTVGKVHETIWAEEGSNLTNNNRQWSFGNGSVGTVNIAVLFDCEVTKMFMHCENPGTTVSIDLMVNDLSVGTASFTGNGIFTFASPIVLSEGDFIGFNTNTVSGTWTDSRVGVDLTRSVEGIKGEKGDPGLDGVDGISTNGGAQELDYAKRSSTSTQNITSTPSSIPWQTEIKAGTMITWSSGNNTRLTVTETGTYNVGGFFVIQDPSNQRSQHTIDIRINGVSTGVYRTSGYNRNLGSSWDYWIYELSTTPIELNANDYIEIFTQQHIGANYAPSGSYTATLIGDKSQIWLERYKGAKGSKGDVGAGSNIIVQKDDVTIGTVTDELNFEGTGVTSVFDEGSNKTTVTIDGGTSYTDSEIKTKYENNGNTNAFTDAEKTKVGNLSGVNTGDEVEEYTNLASFPVTGVSGIIYLAEDTNDLYRWNGAYIKLGAVVTTPNLQDVISQGSTATATGNIQLLTSGGTFNQFRYQSGSISNGFSHSATSSLMSTTNASGGIGGMVLSMDFTNGIRITDSFTDKGIDYLLDYSANYTNRTLVDKAYADSKASVQATTSIAGKAAIATQIETHTGTNDTKIVTPLKLQSEKGIANGIAKLDATGKIDASQLSGGGKSMIMSFGSGTNYYVNSNSATYAKVATFMYAGSTQIGPISAIKINAWRSGGTGADFRIYDATNALVVAEVVNVTSTSEINVVNMGTITNIPTALSIFEIQIRRSGGGANGYCGSIEIGY